MTAKMTDCVTNVLLEVPQHKEKTCAICGTLFKPFGHRFICCSSACSKVHKQKLKHNLYNKYRANGKRVEYQENARLKRLSKAIKCTACGKLHFGKKDSKCVRCRTRKPKIDETYHKTNISIFKCLHCGKTVVTKNTRGPKIYCSTICRDRAKVLRDPDKYRLLKLKHDKEKRRTNPEYRVHCAISSSIRKVLRSFGQNKTSRTFELLGYSELDLMRRMSETMLFGMNWDNYGEVWQIDHIKPKSWFRIKTHNDIRRCWALDNLQAKFTTTDIAVQHGWRGEIGNYNKRNRFVG